MRHRTENQIRLILIRHGATWSNEGKKYLGRTQEPLSAGGIADIRRKARAGKYQRTEFQTASPLRRCIQTAELIYERKPDLLIDEWEEIDFGEFEGKSYEDLKENAYYWKWIESNGELPFPKGESKAQFVKRCEKGLQKFCIKVNAMSPMPESAALILHGGTIMALLSSLSKEEYFSFQCGNGEGYSCELYLEDKVRIDRIERL